MLPWKWRWTLLLYKWPSSIFLFVHSILREILKMCRGIHQERNNQGGSCGEEVVSSKATSRLVCCELCGSRASLYCQADDAFLCQKCDKWVHGANFLAQRHVRCMLCNTCQNLTQRYLIGASTEVLLPTIVSWRERRQCNSNLEKKSSGSLKMPFLFLWFCFSFSPFLSLFSSLFFLVFWCCSRIFFLEIYWWRENTKLSLEGFWVHMRIVASGW